MIFLVLGTKAQLIKMAPVMLRLSERGIPYRFFSTGQHQATMQQILKQFELRPPDEVLYQGQEIDRLSRVPGWMLKVLLKTARQYKHLFGPAPDGILLVHGDTLSTLLGALMGRVAGLQVGHVEAGLRSFCYLHPFPEELTRLATFRLSHILFCPGPWAVGNVAGTNRNIIDTQVNTLADAVTLALEKTSGRHQHSEKPYGLVSIHRFENLFVPSTFESLMTQLKQVADVHPLVFILHPATRQRLQTTGWLDRLNQIPAISIRPRTSYFEFISLLQSAQFVITDGGSIQEESSYLGIPCLLWRKATERKEGLDKNAVLCNQDLKRMMDFVTNHRAYRTEPIRSAVSASDIIVDSIQAYA